MADLTNPTVSVSYRCGCSFTDTREHAGVVVAVYDDKGNQTGTRTLTGETRFRYAADEPEAFRAKQQLAQAKNATERRAVLTGTLARIADDGRKPSRASLEAKGTPDDVYQALLERPADDVPDVVSEGIRFPQPPAHCPRHGQPAQHTHASYLNPADQTAEETP